MVGVVFRVSGGIWTLSEPSWWDQGHWAMGPQPWSLPADQQLLGDSHLALSGHYHPSQGAWVGMVPGWLWLSGLDRADVETQPTLRCLLASGSGLL